MKEDYLSNELKELYSFVRSDILAYITWFTVFTTVNFTAIGFLLLNNMSQYLVLIISIFMFFQNIFGIMGSLTIQKQIKSRSEKAILIGKEIDTKKTGLIGTLLSDGYYEKIYGALIAGLILLLICWGSLPIYYPYLKL